MRACSRPAAGCAAPAARRTTPTLQILTPHYLFNADGSAGDAAGDFERAGTGRLRHELRRDDRLPASPRSRWCVSARPRTPSTTTSAACRCSFRRDGDNAYMLQAPSNPGIALPGMYMLFALNADGVPSVARIVRIGGTATPQLDSPSDQSATLNAPTSLALAAIVAGRIDAELQRDRPAAGIEPEHRERPHQRHAERGRQLCGHGARCERERRRQQRFRLARGRAGQHRAMSGSKR